MIQQDFIMIQGSTIAAALTKQGYEATKMNKYPGWSITSPRDDWWLMLTFLPSPVRQWRLLPANSDPVQTEIYSVIEQTIGGRR